MEDLEDTIPEFLQSSQTFTFFFQVLEESTCSADVLIKTGGPFKQDTNIGTSFFKKAGYMGPEM